MNYWAENWAIWVSAFCVLAIYSYLLKDNPVYRVMMQVFIGVNAGYYVVVQWRDILYPRWWLPMTDGIGALFGGKGSPWGALWVLVGVLGLLWYFQLSRRFMWLSRIVIGVTVGIGAGLTFKSQLGQTMPQVADSFRPLTPAVVATQPRVLFRTPGVDVAPVLSGSVAYMAKGRELLCVEMLNGVEVWRAALPGKVTGPVTLVGETVVTPTDAGLAAFDPSGRSVAAPAEGPSDPTRFEIGANGVAKQVQVAPMANGFALRDATTGTTLWQWAQPGTFIGQTAGLVFVGMQSGVTALDGVTGEQRMHANLSSPVTGVPAVASYRDPQFDNGVLLVPTKAGVGAFALKENPAPNTPKGAMMWNAKRGVPITAVSPMKGVALACSADGCEMLELPKPTARLRASDYFDNWVFVVTMLCVMTYFFFSFKNQGKVVKASSRLGRWLLMVGFGAFFGNTVMTRMTYLLDRLMFLVDDWMRPFIIHLLGR